MNLDVHRIHFPGRYAPDEIRAALDRGFDTGWTTTRDGDDEEECLLTDPENERYKERVETETAVDVLAERGDARVTIFPSDTQYDFSLAVDDDWSEYGLPGLGGVTLVFPAVHFREQHERAAEAVVDAATVVYEALEPTLAFSYLPFDHERETTVRPEHVEAGHLPDAFWLQLLSEPLVDAIGRDRLETAPAWRVQSLADGGIALVASADPREYTRSEKRRLREHLGVGD